MGCTNHVSVAPIEKQKLIASTPMPTSHHRSSHNRETKHKYNSSRPVVWSCDIEGHADTCVASFLEKPYQHQSRRKHLAWMIINLHPKMPTVQKNWHRFALRSFLNACTLARIGRPDLLWTVNMPARSVAKWNKAWDQRLARFKSYINQKNISDSTFLLEIKFRTANLDCFGMFFRRRLARLKINFRRSVMRDWTTRTCSTFWMCKKETAVSRRLQNGRCTSIAIVGLCFRSAFAFRC